jgi:hypothetical protein
MGGMDKGQIWSVRLESMHYGAGRGVRARVASPLPTPRPGRGCCTTIVCSPVRVRGDLKAPRAVRYIYMSDCALSPHQEGDRA